MPEIGTSGSYFPALNHGRRGAKLVSVFTHGRPGHLCTRLEPRSWTKTELNMDVVCPSSEILRQEAS
jgi:hypothetical protein